MRLNIFCGTFRVVAHALAYDREGYALFFSLWWPKECRATYDDSGTGELTRRPSDLRFLVEYPGALLYCIYSGTPRVVLEYGQQIAGAVAMGFVFVYYLHDLRG